MEDLNFINKNPGAVKFGNFINYYQFHPPENRLKLLPYGVFDKNKPLIALDIGCNAGDLTIALFEELVKNGFKCHILGIDIDPILIKRAKEQNTNEHITFECLDFMDANQRTTIVNNYLQTLGASKFSATFCFSVTMWIHLNNGDEGLRKFLCEVCDISELIVVEPQPWKCYKTAVARLKKSGSEFPLFKELKIRENVEFVVEDFILESNGFLKVCETERTKWERKLSIFKKVIE